MTQNWILIIAGPNGAGKTTFAEAYLPNEGNCPEFVNADLIAAGISPFQPEQAAITAGRIMLRRISELVASRRNFGIETTLSARSYLRLIPNWQAAGYHVKLIYLRLPDAEFAIRRVEQRVRLGGHPVPAGTIRRRFLRGWNNLRKHYIDLVDEWVIYDSAQFPPQLIDCHKNNPPRTLMEDKTPYPYKKGTLRPATKDVEMDFSSESTALARAATTAIKRARKAGLEPVAIFSANPEK